MQRTKGLRRAGRLKRTALRRVSKRRRKQGKARRAAVAEAHENAGGMCQWPLGCTELGTDPHEKLTRARGGSVTDVKNIVILCRRHHDYVHEHPKVATELGLLVSQYGAK